MKTSEIFDIVRKKYHKILIKNLPIEKNTVLIDSMFSSKLNGELFYLAKFILENHSYLKLTISTKYPSDFLSAIPKHLRSRVNFTNRISPSYSKHLACSEFLFNDVSFPRYFIKRVNQKYINVWHGTPIKTLGIDIDDNPLTISNMQYNFNLADEIYINNSFLKNIILNKYLVKDAEKIKVMKSLKNNIFKKSEKVNKKNNVTFLLTWLEKYKEDPKSFVEYIKNIDEEITKQNIDSNYSFEIKLHHYMSNDKNFSTIKKLNNIKISSKPMETSELIDSSQVIVTDYSSVLFDAALMNKKVIIDHSQLNDFRFERGIYEEILDDLPFEVVSNPKDLVESIARKKEIDYSLFNQKYSDGELIDNEKFWPDLVFSKDWNDYKLFSDGMDIFYPGKMTKFYGKRLPSVLEEFDLNPNNTIIWLTRHYVTTISKTDVATLIEKGYYILMTDYIKPWNINYEISHMKYFKDKKMRFWNKKLVQNYFSLQSQKYFGKTKYNKIILNSPTESYANGILSSLDSNEIITNFDRNIFIEPKYHKYSMNSMKEIISKSSKITFANKNIEIQAKKNMII